MNDIARKNLHLPDEVVRLIGDVLHSARFRSETQAVIAMLEGASDRLKDASGYVYLMRGPKGLKIGTSIQPNKRAQTLKSELLYCIPGDRLTELAVHMIWGRYRLSATGEWFEDRPDIVRWFEGHPMSVPLVDVVDAADLVKPEDAPAWLVEELGEELLSQMRPGELRELLLAHSTMEAAKRAYDAAVQKHTGLGRRRAPGDKR